MADDLHYASNKRKFDDHGVISPTVTRRATGLSPLVSPPPDNCSSLSNSAAPLPLTAYEFAKQRAQEIVARIFNKAKAENCDGSTISSDISQKSLDQPIVSHVGVTSPSSVATYGYQGPSKKIEIPKGKVGVIVGKGGETIKYLQSQSAAKIQIAEDMDVDPYSQTILVEIIGNSEQMNKAEQLINDVLSEADAGGSGIIAARKVGNVPYSAEQFVMEVPNNRVGSIIGKGGEVIKNMQAKSGARIHVIPLHLSPGNTSQERTVQIDGTKEQIEAAKQLINEVISVENRMWNQPISGAYSQQAYRPPTRGPPGAPQMQQPGYGYMQPTGAYPSETPQYGAYPSSYPDQSSNQTVAATTGYDYYGQQPLVGGSAAPTDNSSYGQPQGYQFQQGYAYPSQDGLGPTYGATAQAGPAPPPVQAYSTQVQGYDGQQQSYGQSPMNQVGYGYGPQPQAQSGYGQAPPSSAYGSQLGYGQQLSFGVAYSQPQAYSTDNAGRVAYEASTASPAVPTGVAKASPSS